MRIDFRIAGEGLTAHEEHHVATQLRFATRYHDVPLAGLRVETQPDGEDVRCRLTAIERGASTVVAERSAPSVLAAIHEATSVLDRALHRAAMDRAQSPLEAYAA